MLTRRRLLGVGAAVIAVAAAGGCEDGASEAAAPVSEPTVATTPPLGPSPTPALTATTAPTATPQATPVPTEMPTPTETPVLTETPTPTETPAPINTPTIRPPRGLHPAGPDAEGRFPYDPGDRALPDSLQTLSAENLSEV